MTTNDVSKYIFNGQKVTVTSSYGSRTYYNGNTKISDFHQGIDYVVLKNGKSISTNVYAINTGVVDTIGKDSVSGNYLYIKYPTLGIRVFYCHLKSIYVKKNQKVTNETKVALTGKTGNATGIHLHLGIKYINYNNWVNPKSVSLTKYNYLYAANKYLKVYTKKTTDNLNLRSEPNTKSNILLTIPVNKRVIITKENYSISNGFTWDKVKYNNVVGYVANEYLKLNTLKTTDYLNVRVKPSTTAEIITTLTKGKEVKVNKRKVKYNNGYYFDEIEL